MAALLLASFTACGGLTDEEKKFLGTWTCEEHEDQTEDDIRYIFTGHVVVTFNEDKTYDQESESMLKFEFDYDDATVRLYMYIEGSCTSAWSAKDGVYKDSTMTSSFRNTVATHNVVAIRDKSTGKIERYGLNDPKLRDKYKTELIDLFKEYYDSLSQACNEFLSKKDKNIYKIVSLGANRIVYEDNDGEQTELRRGRIVSTRVGQMLQEGNALK